MTDRPILFSGPMVRALLAGTKTQTRRDLTKTFARYPHLVGYETDGNLKKLDGKNVPHVEFVHSLLGLWHPEDNPRGRSGWYVPLKAAVGDQLWVREAWRCNGWATDVATIFYAASEGDGYTAMCEQYPVADKRPLRVTAGWRPSIHMPRWASRLTLIVTDVRVERLQDISEADAKAEGVSDEFTDYELYGQSQPYRFGYSSLWNLINGEGAWDANPWVVAYTFTVQRGNIDQIAQVAA
jgi:hypothetical protein